MERPGTAKPRPAPLSSAAALWILAVDSETFLYLPLDQGGASHRNCPALTFLQPLTVLPAVLEPADTCRSKSTVPWPVFKGTSRKNGVFISPKTSKD